jgi:hypothetical protein
MHIERMGGGQSPKDDASPAQSGSLTSHSMTSQSNSK